MERSKKKVSDSTVEMIHVIRPQYLNSSDQLFGGILMQWIDETAGFAAKRHACTNVTTALIDNLQFLRLAYKGELIVLVSKLTYVGRTSMEVQVETFSEALDGSRVLINRAYVTMVSVDENDRPVVVPELLPETEAEKKAWEAGKRRRELRELRQREGF